MKHPPLSSSKYSVILETYTLQGIYSFYESSPKMAKKTFSLSVTTTIIKKALFHYKSHYAACWKSILYKELSILFFFHHRQGKRYFGHHSFGKSKKMFFHFYKVPRQSISLTNIFIVVCVSFPLSPPNQRHSTGNVWH